MKGTRWSLPLAITPGEEGKRGWTGTTPQGGRPRFPRELTRRRVLQNPAPRLPLFLAIARRCFCIFHAGRFPSPRFLRLQGPFTGKSRHRLTKSPGDTVGEVRRPALGTGLPSALPLHDPLRQVEDVFRSEEVELRGRLLLHHLVERFQRLRLTDPLEESLTLVKVRMDGEKEMG